jgi:hypothetical protein
MLYSFGLNPLVRCLALCGAGIFEVAAEAAVAAAKHGQRVPLAAMTAHADMRMVGVLQPSSFQPIMPALTEDMAVPA